MCSRTYVVWRSSWPRHHEVRASAPGSEVWLGAGHQLVHGRPDADRFHVRGFIEHGTTTTPFDMTVLNKISRFHLVMDALNNSGALNSSGSVRRTASVFRSRPAPRAPSSASGCRGRAGPRSRTHLPELLRGRADWKVH